MCVRACAVSNPTVSGLRMDFEGGSANSVGLVVWTYQPFFYLVYIDMEHHVNVDLIILFPCLSPTSTKQSSSMLAIRHLIKCFFFKHRPSSRPSLGVEEGW